jgi:hypothetical protein
LLAAYGEEMFIPDDASRMRRSRSCRPTHQWKASLDGGEHAVDVDADQPVELGSVMLVLAKRMSSLPKRSSMRRILIEVRQVSDVRADGGYPVLWCELVGQLFEPIVIGARDDDRCTFV